MEPPFFFPHVEPRLPSPTIPTHIPLPFPPSKIASPATPPPVKVSVQLPQPPEIVKPAGPSEAEIREAQRKADELRRKQEEELRIALWQEEQKRAEQAERERRQRRQRKCEFAIYKFYFTRWRKVARALLNERKQREEAERKEREAYQKFVNALGTNVIEPGLQGSSTTRLAQLLGNKATLPPISSPIERFDYHEKVVQRMLKLREQRRRRRMEAWAPLDIPNLITDVLSRKNPTAKSLYWKIVMIANSSSVTDSDTLSSWLIAKFTLGSVIPHDGVETLALYTRDPYDAIKLPMKVCIKNMYDEDYLVSTIPNHHSLRRRKTN